MFSNNEYQNSLLVHEINLNIQLCKWTAVLFLVHLKSLGSYGGLLNFVLYADFPLHFTSSPFLKEIWIKACIGP